MLKKTFRSALSMLLALCLLFGMSGNAIALAAGNPVSSAIDQVDAEFNAVIAELEALIADLEGEVATQWDNYNNAVSMLETGKGQLATGEALLNEYWPQLKDAQTQLDDAAVKLEMAESTLKDLTDQAADYRIQLDAAKVDLDAADITLKGYETDLDIAKIELANAEEALKPYQDAYDDLLAELIDNGLTEEEAKAALAETEEGKALAKAEAELARAKAQYEAADATITAYRVEWTGYYNTWVQADANLTWAEGELAKANVQFEDAKKQHADLDATVKELDAKFQEYDQAIEDAKAAIEVAEGKDGEEGALVKAERALKAADQALLDARATLENVKATYATLHGAVTNPTVSLDFVRDTYNTLNDQINVQLWGSLLTLQTSLHTLSDAYAELAGLKIEPILVEEFDFGGLTVDIKVDAYYYKGEQIFAGVSYYKEIPAKYIAGIDFKGFTAPEMDARLTVATEKLDLAIAKAITLNAAFEHYTSVAKKILAKALDMTEEALGITISTLKANLNKESAVKVYNWLYDNPEKVCSVVKEFGLYGLALLVEYGDYALDLLDDHFGLAVKCLRASAVGIGAAAVLGAKLLGYVGDHVDFLDDYQGYVSGAVKKLYAKYGDEAKALVEVYVDYLQLRERYYNATHADFEVTYDSYYVAIGDESALGDKSYVDLLAYELGVVNYANLAESGLTVEAALAALESMSAEIAKADLITVGFSDIAATYDAMEAFMIESADVDWTALMSEDAASIVEKTLAELRVDLAAQGMDTDFGGLNLADALVAAVEAYAYTYVANQLKYPALVNEIHAVNPEALVVLVGMYNELEGLTLTVEDKEFALGCYVQAVVDVANIESLLYAVLNENTIYVHAPAVETEMDAAIAAGEADNSLTAYISGIIDGWMVPTEAGHAYIQECIYDALNVTRRVLLGDVNLDGRVNVADLNMLYRYSMEEIDFNGLQKVAADLTQNDKINVCDLNVLYRYMEEDESLAWAPVEVVK